MAGDASQATGSRSGKLAGGVRGHLLRGGGGERGGGNMFNSERPPHNTYKIAHSDWEYTCRSVRPSFLQKNMQVLAQYTSIYIHVAVYSPFLTIRVRKLTCHVGQTH